jgi:hypothetical protein
VRRTVFGLDVWAHEPPAVLEGACAESTGRALELLVEERVAWPADARALGVLREGERVVFAVESDPRAGYLLHGSGYGEHLLSADGLRLRCVPADLEDAAWQRFLVAQVLPFAAVVNGLEVLHASAVELGGGAVALVGRSGAGKTSLALALCELGAGFLADDVLALELLGDGLLGHPGTPLAGVVDGGRERMVATGGAAGPVPLAAVLCLERDEHGPPVPSFEPIGDAAPLLSATFNLMLCDERRLRRLLEACALAARGRVERVRFGPGVGVARLAEAVHARLHDAGG